MPESFMVNICNSADCAEIYLINVFFQLDKRHSGFPIRLVIAVRGFRSKCIWNGVMFSLLRRGCLIVLIASCTPSSNVNPSAMFALVNDLIVCIVLSTWPLPVCGLDVHPMRFILSRLQNSLNSLLLKQLPLSVQILRGVPLSEQYFVKNFKAVRKSVFLQIFAVGHLLNWLIAIKIYTSPQVFDFIGPAKSNWISWFSSDKISNLFISVDGIRVLRFLPADLQLKQFSAFPREILPGHQNASADWSIFVAEECSWWSIAMIIVRIVSGIIILSL